MSETVFGTAPRAFQTHQPFVFHKAVPYLLQTSLLTTYLNWQNPTNSKLNPRHCKISAYRRFQGQGAGRKAAIAFIWFSFSARSHGVLPRQLKMHRIGKQFAVYESVAGCQDQRVEVSASTKLKCILMSTRQFARSCCMQISQAFWQIVWLKKLKKTLNNRWLPRLRGRKIPKPKTPTSEFHYIGLANTKYIKILVGFLQFSEGISIKTQVTTEIIQTGGCWTNMKYNSQKKKH